MKTPHWPLAAMLAGLALIVIGPLLLAAAPAQTYWTDKDQAQYQQASAEFHAAAHSLPDSADGASFRNRRSGFDPVAAKAKYAETKAEWERQSNRLHSAQSRRIWLLWGVRLLGACLAAVGIVGYAKARRQT